MSSETRGSVTPVGDMDFDRVVVDSDIPVLVDFWAQWCEPCRILSPMLARLSVRYAGRIRVVKVDVDSNSIAFEYAIRSIPTVMLFHKGKVVTQWVGLHAQSDYEEAIQGIL